MARIETVGRVGAAQFPPARLPRDRALADAAIPAGRALVLLDGGSGGRTGSGSSRRDARADAGFVAHLLACADPGLRPSRLERTRAAANLYAETARRTA